MRKLRTRQHIVGDLGVNHVERQVLLAGFTFERIVHDYGLDAAITTFDEKGQVETTQIRVQVKSTESPNINVQKNAYAFDLSVADLEYWLLNRWDATLLVLYDHRIERAFFIEMKAYFFENVHLLRDAKKYIRVFVPISSIFKPESVKNLRLPA